MSEKNVLNAVKREVTGKKVKALRRDGKLPAVIYGAGIEPTSITLEMREASRTLRTVTSATLVTLNLDGEEYNALVRDRQYDILSRELSHIDFLAVAMNVLLKASVPLRLVGDAPVAKEIGSMIMQEAESLEVQALPRNLPEAIDVDISILDTLGMSITIADLDLGDDVEILDDPETVIAVAISIAMEEEEEEEEEVDEFGELAEPELVERGKREDEEEEEE